MPIEAMKLESEGVSIDVNKDTFDVLMPGDELHVSYYRNGNVYELKGLHIESKNHYSNPFQESYTFKLCTKIKPLVETFVDETYK